MLLTPSRIFEPVQTLASYCSQVPVEVRYDSTYDRINLVTAVEAHFNVFALNKLNRIQVSEQFPSSINCVAAKDYIVLAGCGSNVYSSVRGKIVGKYEGHERDVVGVKILGDWGLSWDVGSNVHVFDKVDFRPHISLSLGSPEFSISCCVHPRGYMNKVLFGSHTGSYQLWNMRTGRLVYTFQGQCDSAVTCMDQSEAEDVVGVGYYSGVIAVVDLKMDKLIMQFRQTWGKVTALSFRKDSSPQLVTASQEGNLAIWDLESQSLVAVMKEVPGGPITGLHFVASQPLLVTSSAENVLRVWIMDAAVDGGKAASTAEPRVLYQRFGQGKGAICRVRFYGPELVLAAGHNGSLMKLSPANIRLSHYLGKARLSKGKKKVISGLLDEHVYLTRVAAISANPARQSDFDSCVTCHHNSDVAVTWDIEHNTLGKHRIPAAEEDILKSGGIQIQATCCDISSCGTFVIIGYSCGTVQVANIQSADVRCRLRISEDESLVGVAVDALNSVLVTAIPSKLVFWNFHVRTGKKIGELKLSEDISSIRMNRENCLLAAILIDFTVELVDYESRNSVRQFTGHKAPIVDLAFSADSRWLVTSCMDSCIRVWHIPTGSLIDCFITSSPATSIDISPSGDSLVAAFTNSVGVTVFSNTSLFKLVNLTPLPANFKPSTGNTQPARDDSTDDSSYESPAQIEGLLTLSKEDPSKWVNLIKFDVIKQRNKPKQPPKTPSLAPFFIPTIPGLELQLDTEKAKEEMRRQREEQERNLISEDISILCKMLRNKDCTAHDVVSFLMSKSSAAVDFELLSLSEEEGGGADVIGRMLSILCQCLEDQTDLDFVHAVVSVLLRHHGEFITESGLVESIEEDGGSSSCMAEKLKSLQHNHEQTWPKLCKLFQQNIAVASFFKSPAV